MDTSNLLQFLLAGLTTGSVYALIALGFTVILNSTDVINVAQGEMVMLGGVFAVTFVKLLGLPAGVAILAAVLLVALLGAVMHTTVIAPVRHAPPMTFVMITLAVSVILSSSAALIWGSDPMHIPSLVGDQPYVLFGAALAPQILWILGVAATTMVGLHVFYNRTRVGQAMLACNIDRDMAALVGIDVRRMVLSSFMLGAAMAGLAGALVTPLTSVSVYVGLTYTLKGFAAAVFGGLGKSQGAVVGGLGLGLLEAFGSGLLSTGYRDFISLSVILLVLLVRPSGLLGSRLES